MSIKVSIKPRKTVVSSVNIGPKPNLNLGQILNVDASDPDNGEVLVYDAGLATFQSFTVTNSTVAATDVVHVA